VDDPNADQTLYFDEHARKMFEEHLLGELAFAAGIPKANLLIEEVDIVFYYFSSLTMNFCYGLTGSKIFTK
jgi:hypothetical protein